MKVYTRTGDGGTTSLIGGERVSKADVRVEAYGTVDELAAHLALLADGMRADGRFDRIPLWIDDIQRDLMVVEAVLADGRGPNPLSVSKPASPGMTLDESAVARLEAQIDEMSESLPPLEGFTLPGGHPIVSQSHVCRTVCRRAERATIRVSEQYSVSREVVEYLNRLSDYLYVVGRKAVDIIGVKETYWIP